MAPTAKDKMTPIKRDKTPTFPALLNSEVLTP